MGGINDQQNNSGDRESPSEIPQFILIFSDFIDHLVWFRNKLIFHNFKLFLRKLIMTLRDKLSMLRYDFVFFLVAVFNNYYVDK